MRRDLDVIVKRYPRDQEVLRIYALGDVHAGSPEFNEDAVLKKIRHIKDDPCAAVCLVGDLGDYGLRNSKSNVYLATMNVEQQQRYLYELFLPIKDKIISAVPGNHEERLVREAGLCPLYDLCVKWDLEDIYRPNVSIVKVLFGNQRGKQQQVAFIGITSHGSTRNKHHRFMGSFDGQDWSISAHTHLPEYRPEGRIRINRQKGNAVHVPYKELVVDAHLSVGGYGLKKEYEIPAPPELQYLELSYKFDGTTRDVIRIMNYHSIQL